MLPFFTSAQVEMLDQVVAIVDDDIILASELQERVQGVRATMELRGVEVPETTSIRETLDRLISTASSCNWPTCTESASRINSLMNPWRGSRSKSLTLSSSVWPSSNRGSCAAARKGSGMIWRSSACSKATSRNINISEQEIDNFLATEEGEAMTQPEYRVVQALLSSGRSEDATTVAAKEKFVDAVLDAIQGGTPFEEAVSAPGPYTFSGGDLGWRKLGDIPSMFADVVPSLSVGDVTKVRSSSGFHLVFLADAEGERLVRQTDVRHILIKPTEVLSEEAAEALAGDLKSRIAAGETFGDLARQYSDDIGSAAEGGAGLTNPGQMVPEFEATMAATAKGSVSEPFRVSLAGIFSK